MGIRTRSATPGTLLLLVCTALLAVVSFNTPLLKSLYFLKATYSSGRYSGTVTLGTLGYCLDTSGTVTCTGPKVGYEFNPNDLLGVTVFDIPEAITKYLTYTLILHIIALACATASVIFGLLSHIGSMSVMCFPTCTASCASSFALLALIFDLVIFYIAKARIDKVSGAHAEIGVSVWLTLAAWLVAGIGGCAYGVGQCCVGRRRTREGGDDKRMMSGDSDDMRLMAIRDEERRKKEQGLPNFQELERAPLTADEDKYLYEEVPPAQTMPGGLRRDGSVVQGVGQGYGRRTPKNGGYTGLNRAPTSGSAYTAGAAGLGSGGAGVERPDQYGQYYDPSGYDQQYHDPSVYPDPYQMPQQYGYAPQQLQGQSYPTYPPQTHTPNPLPIPTPAPAARGYDNNNYYSGPSSNDGHYPDPGPQVRHADPYDGYDDGLGNIGMMATSPDLNRSQPQPSDYGTTGTYRDDQYQHQQQQQPYGSGTYNNLHVPTPQHLATQQGHANILRSPMSPGSEGHQQQRRDVVGQRGYDYGDNGDDGDLGGGRPPSYGDVAGPQGQNESQGQSQNQSQSRQYPQEKQGRY